MINTKKKAQMMALYLPFLTLFMCGVIIGMYWMQGNHVQNSFISPVSLLNFQDEKEIFEMQEKELVISTVKSNLASSPDAIKNSFCASFSSGDFSDWIFRNLSYKEKDDVYDSFKSSSSRGIFCNEVYKFSLSGDKINVERGELKKKFNLDAPEEGNDKIKFPMKLEVSFSKTYSIPKTG